MDCPHKEKCPMFTILEGEQVGKVIKKMWCVSERHYTCARYKLSSEGKTVPTKMLPNGKIFNG